MTTETTNHDSASQPGSPGAGNVVTLPTPREESKTQAATNFVREHPLMCIAGGLAVGAMAAALIPRRNRERVAGGASHLAELVSAATVMLGQQALSRAELAGEAVSGGASALAGRAERLGGSARETAEHWSEIAAQTAAKLMPGASSRHQGVTGKIAEKAGQIKGRFRH